MTETPLEEFGDLVCRLNEIIYNECDENQFQAPHITKKNEAGVALKIWEEHFTKFTADLVKISKADPQAIHGMACREIAVAKVRLHLSELLEEITRELMNDGH